MPNKKMTIHLPETWAETIKVKAKESEKLPATYLRDIIQNALNLQTPVELLDKATPRKGLRQAKKSSVMPMQIALPRKAQKVLLGMADRTNWSLQFIAQRIIETDIGVMPSKATVQPLDRSKLAREYSEEGKKFSEDYWAEYYRDNPQSPTYNLSFSVPLDWQEALQAKANMSATTVYKLVRGAIMKRLGE